MHPERWKRQVEAYIPLTISPLQIEHGQIVVISSVFTIRRSWDIYLIEGGRQWVAVRIAYSFVTSIPDIYWLNRKFNGRFHRATSTESTRALRARLRVAMRHRCCVSLNVHLQSGRVIENIHRTLLYFSRLSALETLEIFPQNILRSELYSLFALPLDHIFLIEIPARGLTVWMLDNINSSSNCIIFIIV